MINISTLSVSGFIGAIIGMRKPLKSGEQSDSRFVTDVYDVSCLATIGPKDMELCQKLLRAGGDDHSKYMRMIHVQADVNAPLYWWKEFDAYKIAIVENSESTMHTIHKKEFGLHDFSHDYLDDMDLHITWANQDYHDASLDCLYDNVGVLNALRERYLKAIERKDPEVHKIWYQMIQILPESYMQSRVIDLNYQTLRNIYFARRNHKLNEWHKFCDWIKDLPYAEDLITYNPGDATIGGTNASN